MAKTGFVYDEFFLKHKTGAGHPERPERLTAIVENLKKKDLLRQLQTINTRDAEQEWIETIHDADYIERVKAACEDGDGHVDTMDCPVSPMTYAAAVRAAGAMLSAVDAVVAGDVKNAFCAVRPPGHHALRNRAMGFCYFNNVAIAARYAQKKHSLSRVLIIDWDVHHGNGTQAAFYEDPTVIYFSTHLYPFYPGSGAADERGAGKGVGFTINCPMRAGAGDAECLKAFNERLVPAAKEFHPDIVLISAGFDAREDDLLGRMQVTDAGFAEMTRIVKKIAADCCGGRLVSTLEGGYYLEGLALAAEAHVRALME